MVMFPGFGGWINQNIQKSLIKAESKRSDENVKSNSESESGTNTQLEVDDDTKKQLKLWRNAEKKKPWHDSILELKVEKQDLGISIMDVVFTLGLPPQAAYDILTNPDNQPYSKNIKKRGLLENVSRKVKEEGKDGEIVDLKIDVPVFLNILSVPLTLRYAEIRPSLKGVYNIKKMMFMELFEGDWTVEPTYVDSRALCKQKKPESLEEYRKCSGGRGKLASNVKVGVFFKPSFPFNLPPLSWCVRETIVKSTKTLVQDFQHLAAAIRRD